MSHFDLPHRHSNQRHAEKLRAELTQIRKFDEASEMFRLLGDPTRVRILWLLSHREECVVNIAAMLEMSSPAVFHHLRALSDGGLIEGRRDGKEVFYRAADTDKSRLLHDMLEQVMEIACPEKADAANAPPEEIVRGVHDYLMEHLGERVTIEALSGMFHINTTTLKQAFKKVYGTSIAAHMKAHRMQKAARLLRESRDPVAAIAQCVGYESQSRFTTAFKEVYHVLPTAYRRKCAEDAAVRKE